MPTAQPAATIAAALVAACVSAAAAGDPPSPTTFTRTADAFAEIPGIGPPVEDAATSEASGPDTITAGARRALPGQRAVADALASQSCTLRTGTTITLDLTNRVSLSNQAVPDDPLPVARASSGVTLAFEVFGDTPYDLEATATPGFGFDARFVVRLTGPSGDVLAYDSTLDLFSDPPETFVAEGVLTEGAYTFTATAAHDVAGDASGHASLVGALTIGDDPACSRADLASPLGVLDLADLVEFVTLFLAQDPRADLILNGVWDLDDLNDFIAAFTVGCP